MADPVEIVDYDGIFHADFGPKFEKELHLKQCRLKFNVVAVLGCQSSGKSTLLNAMFSTRFPEMETMAGRGQTTKGIWCGRDRDSNTLVIDVEGTDSKERGEDRLTFEHRASLFSLAIADVVIVNMWYHDIGRYAASNYGLLKTVFAVNLELFQSDPASDKTLLLFVIRDHSAKVTPLEMLEKQILQDVQQIWSEIKKPATLQHSPPDRFFTFRVWALPNKLESPDAFAAKVAELKSQLVKPDAEYSRKVPADGFPLYAESVWKTIMSSQQLDIPSQKEMVAVYRCEEIKLILLSEAREAISKNVDEKVLFKTDFILQLVETIIRKYHEEAWRYEAHVYVKKRQELIDAIYSEFQKIYDKYLNGARQNITKQCTEKIAQLTKKDPFDSSLTAGGISVVEFWKNFNQIMTDWRDESLELFDGLCLSASVAGKIEFDAEAESVDVSHVFSGELVKEIFGEGIGAIEGKHRKVEEVCFKKFLQRSVDVMVKDIEMLYSKANVSVASFWKEVTELFVKRVDDLYSSYGSCVRGILNCDEERALRQMNIWVFDLLRETFGRRCDRLSHHLHMRFKTFFECDDKGAPHYWPSLSSEQVKKVYLEARKKAEELYPVISAFQLDIASIINDASYEPPAQPVISETDAKEALILAQKLMLKSCQEAQFIQATGGRMATPAWWVWIIMLILGWNEIMFVIRSPVTCIALVTFTAILIGAYYTQNMVYLMNSTRLLSSYFLGAILPLMAKYAALPEAPSKPIESNAKEQSDQAE